MRYCFLFIFLYNLAIALQAKPSAGTITQIDNFKSKFIDARNVSIWLPSTYSRLKKYDVLYMHDGQMLFDSTSNWNHQEWQVDETVERLIKEGKIRDIIVVGIWNNGKYRRSEYFPQKPIQMLPPEIKDTLISSYLHGKMLSDNYLLFLTKELKPFIDSVYSTNRGRENTFIAGSSMGGLISLYAICEYPAIFGSAACLSTNWPGVVYKCESIPVYFVDYIKRNLPTPKNHKIYFDYGTIGLDSLYKPHQLKVDEVMRNKGYSSKNWMTKEFVGENHSEKAWSKRLALPLEFLLYKK